MSPTTDVIGPGRRSIPTTWWRSESRALIAAPIRPEDPVTRMRMARLAQLEMHAFADAADQLIGNGAGRSGHGLHRNAIPPEYDRVAGRYLR